ncbi:MAG: pyridoxamine 5'-phosphate oxidase family protein [Rhodobacterales bacterium]|nr:pyridoxamine 5'-phosphate oxidase family protein [Rhodobacterales bacterium]
MARQFPAFEPEHLDFIAAQPVFFVATTAPGARINLSPKGMDSLRVTAPDRLVWLNLTGSGNETAAHLRLDDRMTVMWCSFGPRPLILRACGRARLVYPGDPGAAALFDLLPAQPGARQAVQLAVDLVQSSCGYGVPQARDMAERPTLRHWAEEARGEDGLRAYRAEKNRRSLDGLPTGLDADRDRPS